MPHSIDRRAFLQRMALGAGAVSLGSGIVWPGALRADDTIRRAYDGPNVILVRFGGGVRRRETIDPEHTFSPYLCHTLAKRGTLFNDMRVEQFTMLDDGSGGQRKYQIETSHGQGTLFLITGMYDHFKDAEGKFLGARFESKVPTLFEYVRKAYDVPDHQTLIVNGEDRTDEEFYTYSNHHLFGVGYRSQTLSLYRYKVYLLRRQIAEGKFVGKELEKQKAELAKLETIDYRHDERDGQGNAIDDFWSKWREHFGETGLVNARGDALLTQIALRAMKELRPKLMMINYQDPDYVHWGNMSHYTRGISVIDRGLRQLVDAADADEHYADNTVFVVVPDCGRDSNPFMSVPCQHHFNSRSSREIWALMLGPGIAKGQVVDKAVDQTDIASTIGQVMGFKAKFAAGHVLGDAFA